MYSLYKILSILIYPILIIHANIRGVMGKEEFPRIKERFGFASIKKASDKVIWMHAASVGEVMSIVLLIEKIAKNYPDHQVLVTTNTVTSARLIIKKLPSNAVHQFIPYDSYFSIKRFLNYWKPKLVIFTESELWPNMIIEAKKISKLVLVNARMSDRSFNRWKDYKSLIRKVLTPFDIIFPQSKYDFEHFKFLGAVNLKYYGNIKYSSKTPDATDVYDSFKDQLKGKTVILSSSMHLDEEVIIAKAYGNLKKKYKDLFLILSPRYADKVKFMLPNLEGFNIKMRSKNESIEKDTDLFILDSMGEYGSFYRLSNIVVIGGSFTNRGGQNPIDAAKLENFIICGPNMSNFKQITEDFLENEGIIQVADGEELEKAMERYFEKDSSKMIQKAKDFALSKTDIVDKIFDDLTKWM